MPTVYENRRRAIRDREWLDGQRLEPDAFRCTTDNERITFRFEFKLESEGIACAQAFGGEMRLLAIRPPDNPLSPSKVTLEHVRDSVIGKRNPHHEHPSFSSLDDAIVVIEPLAKLAHRIGKCPTSQAYFDLAQDHTRSWLALLAPLVLLTRRPTGTWPWLRG